MRATTHTEVYRRFAGKLRPHPLRFLAITLSAMRVGFKKKLPLLLLYAPPSISAIVFSFVVYTKYSLQEGRLPIGGLSTQTLAAVAATTIEVSDNIIDYVEAVRYFALLVVAWYGAGLISEDRRLGAQLLYFSRPITRLDYLLGKLLASAAFGALAVVVPTIVICSTAAFASPEWSFITQEGHVIVQALGFTSLWVLVLATVVLCISSLVQRKTLALATFFGWIMLTEAVGRVLSELTEDSRYTLVGLLQTFAQLGATIFAEPRPFDYADNLCFGSIAAYFGLAVCLLVWRMRKLEVVA